ncbi:MAG: hypothetical protein ACOYEV_18855 [Candidatus Nanopelagicales bacterium]
MDIDAHWLQAKLISVVGRMISVEEMRGALHLATSTYYDQLKERRLITMENVTVAARHLGVNEVYLLVECGLLNRAAVEDYVSNGGKSFAPTAIRDVKKPLPDAPAL